MPGTTPKRGSQGQRRGARCQARLTGLNTAPWLGGRLAGGSDRGAPGTLHRGMSVNRGQEKLWRYTSLVRLWSWALIGVGAAMLVVGAAVQAGSEHGLSAQWVGVALGVSGITGVLFYPLLRMWLRKTAPSEYLPRAKRLGGPRRLEAGPSDWRRWGFVTTAFLFVGSAAMLAFLVGVLRDSGPDGIAEGVVVGVVGAWGVVTLGDARSIERTERREGRQYFATGNRPTAAGNRLVWVPADDA